MPIAPLVLVCLLSVQADSPLAVADSLVDVGGHRLHVEMRRGTAPLTIVLEAGGGADASSWGPVAERLSARTNATVVAYDRAGLGGSDLGPADLTPGEEIAGLRRALHRLGAPPRTIVVAHSYGGLLALLHAARHPDRVAALVLVDPMTPRFATTTGDFLDSTLPDLSEPETDRERALARMVAGFEALTGEVGAAEPGLSVPVVVLTAGDAWWGPEAIDTAWRASHEALAAAPGRRLVVVPDTGHDIPNQRPEMVIQAVIDAVEASGPGSVAPRDHSLRVCTTSISLCGCPPLVWAESLNTRLVT